MDFEPAVPSKMRSVHHYADWSYRKNYSVPPRPDLHIPNWLQGQSQIKDPERYLFAFRTLLVPEAMFGIPCYNVEFDDTNEGLGYSYNLIIDGIKPNRDGRPDIPAPDSCSWKEHAPDYLIAAWFSHLQLTAELVESSMKALARGRFVVSAVEARAALEVSARLFFYAKTIEAHDNRQDSAELIYNLFTGCGKSQDQQKTITGRINQLAQIVADTNGWPSLPNLYQSLCSLAHPTKHLVDLYLTKVSGGYILNVPREPYWTNDQWCKDGITILTAAIVATEGFRLSWYKIRKVWRVFLSSRQGSPACNLRICRFYLEDPLRGFGPYNCQTRLRSWTLFLHPVPSQEWRTGEWTNHLAQQLKAFEDDCIPTKHFNHDGASAVCGWTWLRIHCLLELELSITEHLNRGEVDTSAVLSRFALEHAESLYNATQSKNGSEFLGRLQNIKRVKPTGLVLAQTGQDLPPIDGIPRDPNKAAIDIANKGLNHFVHSDWEPRKIYWGYFKYPHGDWSLEIPGRPKHESRKSDDENYDLDNPWSASVALLYVIENESADAIARARQVSDSDFE